MRNIEKTLKGALCTAAAAAGMLVLSGCTNYSKMLNEQPQEYISMASENTATAMVKSNFAEEYAILESALKDGSFDVQFKVEDIGFDGQFYINEKDVKTSALYGFENESGKAEIYVSADRNGMNLGTIGNSGTHVYSMDFATLAEDFASSIFAPDSGSSYALEQEEYDTIVEQIEQFNAAINGEDGNTADEMEKIIDDFLAENPPEIVEKTEMTIGDEAVKANVITYKFDKADISGLCEAYIDNVYEMDAEMSEYYTKDEIKEKVMSAFDEIDSMDVELVYYANNKTHVIMQADCNINIVADEENMDICFSMFYGADPAASKEQTFKASVKYQEQEYALVVTATTEENSTKLDFKIVGDAMQMDLMTIDCTKDDENYTIGVNIPLAYITGEIKGTVKTEKNSFELTVDDIVFNSEESDYTYAPEGKLTVTKGGEYLDLDAEKKLFEITEEEADRLAENIEADFDLVFNSTEVEGESA